MGDIWEDICGNLKKIMIVTLGWMLRYRPQKA